MRAEAAQKAKDTDRATYETAQWETTQFVLAIVADTWVRELQDTDTIYTDVAPKDLLAHLQVGCTVWHALDLLLLHNEMQRYHLEVKGIPEYINMLEDTHKQAGREGRTIVNETLLLFVKTTMLTTERFPRATSIGNIVQNQTRPGIHGSNDTRRLTLRHVSRHMPTKAL